MYFFDLVEKEKSDIVAVSQMPGVDPEVACHRPNVDPTSKPIRLQPRRMAPYQKENVNEEVGQLLSVDFIK